MEKNSFEEDIMKNEISFNLEEIKKGTSIIKGHYKITKLENNDIVIESIKRIYKFCLNCRKPFLMNNMIKLIDNQKCTLYFCEICAKDFKKRIENKFEVL